MDSSTTTTNADPDFNKKCNKYAEKFSENLYIIGNEPTLACYRIQEHVHKSGPMIIDRGSEMKKMNKSLQKCCYGVDYSIKAIACMQSSLPHFQNIQELIKNSIFLKQQLDYEANVKLRVQARQKQSAAAAASEQPTSAKKSAFQRFSGSFDLPATLITSSLSGISHSASADLKELKAALSSQFRQTSTASTSSASGTSSRTESVSTAAAVESDARASTSREETSES